MTFGTYVRNARQAMRPKRTLTSVAKAARMHPSSLCDIEKDRRKPSAAVAKRLARALKLAPADLLALAGILTPKALDLIRSQPKLVARYNDLAELRAA